MADLDARALGVSCSSIQRALLKRALQRNDGQTYVRQHFQREAYNQIAQSQRYLLNVEERHRMKQRRWKLELPPRIATSRAQAMFKRVSTLVSPRITAAIARTHWNGWCTRRRFQGVGACVFNCSASCYDAFEHYPFCAVFKELLRRFLHIPVFNNFQDFLMLTHSLWSDDRVIAGAIAHYALYSAFNAARLSSGRDAEHWLDFMQRQCYFAVQGHKRSSNAFRMF